VREEREPDGPPPLAPGDDLAPGYRVVTHLRRGHDLDVYDLWSEERGCRVIGKTVRPDRLTRRGVRGRLLREGKLLRRLAHPHIVRAYEMLITPAPVVILETLPGETLAHLIDRQVRRPAPREIALLGLHLCSAIGYLHRHNVLHLDLKPSNIVATHGMAKVLDLSLARAPGRSRGGIGTAGYMAPEQILGGQLSFPTDVWGIGAALYELATGEPACDAGEATSDTGDNSPQEICLPHPVRRSRRLPTELATAIDACLSQDPSARPTVAELAASLERVAGASISVA
jgi:eukaryotic-like serine/threonine-protein kinase